MEGFFYVPLNETHLIESVYESRCPMWPLWIFPHSHHFVLKKGDIGIYKSNFSIKLFFHSNQLDWTAPGKRIHRIWGRRKETLGQLERTVNS
jgi:hypothetical protein